MSNNTKTHFKYDVDYKSKPNQILIVFSSSFLGVLPEHPDGCRARRKPPICMAEKVSVMARIVTISQRGVIGSTVSRTGDAEHAIFGLEGHGRGPDGASWLEARMAGSGAAGAV